MSDDTSNKKKSGVFTQKEINALMAKVATEPNVSDVLSQEEINALLSAIQNQKPNKPNESDVLSQEEINALLPAEQNQKPNKPKNSDVLSQEEINALLSAFQDQEPKLRKEGFSKRKEQNHTPDFSLEDEYPINHFDKYEKMLFNYPASILPKFSDRFDYVRRRVPSLRRSDNLINLGHMLYRISKDQQLDMHSQEMFDTFVQELETVIACNKSRVKELLIFPIKPLQRIDFKNDDEIFIYVLGDVLLDFGYAKAYIDEYLFDRSIARKIQQHAHSSNRWGRFPRTIYLYVIQHKIVELEIQKKTGKDSISFTPKLTNAPDAFKSIDEYKENLIGIYRSYKKIIQENG